MNVKYSISGTVERIEDGKAFISFDSLALLRFVNVNVFIDRELQLGDILNVIIYKDAKPKLEYGGNALVTLTDVELDELEESFKLLFNNG